MAKYSSCALIVFLALVFLFVGSSLKAQSWFTQINELSDGSLVVSIKLPEFSEPEISLSFEPDSWEGGTQVEVMDLVLLTSSAYNKLIDTLSSFPVVISAITDKSEVDRFLVYHLRNKPELSNTPAAPFSYSNGMYLFNWQNILLKSLHKNEDNMSVVWRKNEATIMLPEKPWQDYFVAPTISNPSFKFSMSQIPDGTVYANVIPDNTDDFFEQTGKAVFALTNFQQINKSISLVFFFTEEVDNILAYTRNETAVFYLNPSYLNSDNSFALQQTLIHELFHIYMPEQEIVSGSDNQTELWQKEALAEYMAMKMMLKSGLIGADFFLVNMQDKIRKGKTYEGEPLTAYSVSATDNPSDYDAFYTRGAVTLWCLDAAIYQHSNGAMQLEDYLLKNFGRMNRNEILQLTEHLASFINTYSDKGISADLNDFVPTWGILYEAKSFKYYYTIQEVVFATENNKLVVVDPNGMNELASGDLILKLDKKKKTADILSQISSTNGTEMKMVIRRNSAKLKVIVPQEKQKVQTFYDSLSKIQNASKEQILNWERFIN